ncbi:MAG: glycosyltransferase family 4 protein [Parachlamydiales bacterium]
MKVLLIIEQCHPEMSSVPFLGYKLYRALGAVADVTLATHGRNKEALLKLHPDADIVFFPESRASTYYYRFLESFLTRGATRWPLFHTLLYPIYAEFNHAVYKHFSESVARGNFDLVHAFTPIIPRYPVKIASVCKSTPFFLGPVNGGIPFPPGFSEVAKKEHQGFQALKRFAKYLPGYKTTYHNSKVVWVGSDYTLQALKVIFPESNLVKLSENGVDDEYFSLRREAKNGCRALFVGRLEPVKCVDILINALQLMPEKICLTIVGDGSERKQLEALVHKLHLEDFVQFTGWVPHNQLLPHYESADIFCFPSVKDFGGAVILEAMAAGLPIVGVNYGGVGEYADSSCGILLSATDPQTLAADFSSAMEELTFNPSRRLKMGECARQRAKAFSWSAKANDILDTYNEFIAKEGHSCSS